MSGELTERTAGKVRGAVAEALDQLVLAEGYLERSVHDGAAADVHRLVDELENVIATHDVLAQATIEAEVEHGTLPDLHDGEGDRGDLRRADADGATVGLEAHARGPGD